MGLVGREGSELGMHRMRGSAAPPGWLHLKLLSGHVLKKNLGMLLIHQLGLDYVEEGYEFYNLYSWEVGFGIRYAKSRLNVNRRKCMQEIVCACAGKPLKSNSRSMRCGCNAMIRLLRSNDGGWYVCEHRS